MTPDLRRVAPIAGAVALAPAPAAACSLCNWGVMDAVLPPAMGWALWAAGWYLLATVAVDPRDPHVWGFRSVATAMAIVLGSLVLSMAMFGPFLMLLLAVPPLVLAVNTLRPSARRRWSVKRRRLYAVVSGLGLGAAAGLLVVSVTITASRDRVQAALVWRRPSSTVTEADIRRDPQAHLDAIRDLMRFGRPELAADFAGLLARHGEVEMDGPRLLGALRDAGDPECKRWAPAFEAALTELTGVELGPCAGVDAWREVVYGRGRKP